MQLANALVQCLYLNGAIVVICMTMDDCIVKNHLFQDKKVLATCALPTSITVTMTSQIKTCV